jgi:hypothetical protein
LIAFCSDTERHGDVGRFWLVIVRIGLLELIVEAEPVIGVDGMDAERQKQLEERSAEVKELEGHGKLKGVGGTGTKGQVKVDVLQ